jgi:hypothetical protein
MAYVSCLMIKEWAGGGGGGGGGGWTSFLN